MKVLILAALADNYIYLLTDGTQAVVIDPAEPNVVLEALAKENLSLSHILITHHHSDHVGGVAELVKKTGATVIGPSEQKIPHLSKVVKEGDVIEIGSFKFDVMETPGHTLSHIVYYEPNQKWLFSGDTLFGAGCGRLFEGTPQQMFSSLQKIAKLPDETRVYFGHEYTKINLEFALSVEPESSTIKKRLQEIKGSTVPSTIELEKNTNPFLLSPDVTEFTRRREMRDKV